MFRKQANQFEVCIQRATQGEPVEGDLAPLINTVRSVSAVHVPPPPRGLVEGRRRLMAEAASLPARRRAAWRLPVFAYSKMRFAAVVVSLLLVLAFLPGLTHAVANSTADSPLYALKVLGQEARLRLTNNPKVIADLQVSMAEEQLGEIVTSLEQGEPIDPAAADRAGMRLSRAVQAVSHDSEMPDSAPKLRLMSTLQNTHRSMMLVFGGLDPEQEPLYHLMRQMERARQELNAGTGQASGEQERAREGAPPEDQEFGSHGPADSAPGAQHTPGAGGPAAADQGPPADPPGEQTGAGSPATVMPAETPAGTPTPEETTTPPAAQQGSGGGQDQPTHEPGDNGPADNPKPGQWGNDRQSRQP